MKIVCLTENSPGLRYTVNAINRRHGVALVVFEQSKRAMFFRDMKRYGVRDTLYRTRMVAKRLLPGRSDKSHLTACFGDAWEAADADIEQLRTTDINSVAVRAAIEKIRPDVIVCQGTTLVRDATIAGVPFPLNIHAGLSPRYRGSRCTEWAVACGDVLNIGVTVHRLTKDIDGGAILGQARVQVRPEDTIEDVNARNVLLGTQIVCDAIDQLKRDGNLTFLPQPAKQGTMYMRRQYTRFMAQHVQELIRRGEMRRMVANPSCAEEPMVAPWPLGEADEEVVHALQG